jgi:hypothetical protein
MLNNRRANMLKTNYGLRDIKTKELRVLNIKQELAPKDFYRWKYIFEILTTAGSFL